MRFLAQRLAHAFVPFTKVFAEVRRGIVKLCEPLRFTSASLCGKFILLGIVAAHAQRPLLPLPAQAIYEKGFYTFKTNPYQALKRQVTGPANSPDERYRLRVTPAGATLTAVSNAGIQRGLATFRQLLDGSKIQLCDIQDAPRFAWRGLLIDAARHFQPVAVVKRNLDAMAAVKLNVLHWHLSDDQGFRVECRRYPRLHRAGSADGLFYTQAQVREVVRYAAARGIRVVPEFDVPSHTTSWIVAYPRLASTTDSVYAPHTGFRTTNVALDPTRETTFSLLDSVLTEMSGLFPDPYFHVGGDENDGRQWRRSPRIVAFMRANKMVRADSITPDKRLLQAYFMRRVMGTLRRLGKTGIGWDEILAPDLPRPVVIESWRGPKGVAEAARLGHPALRAHGYYLDLYQSAAAHYAADPLAGVPDSLQSRVLGGEAAMWAEFADSVVLDSRLWPRAAAVAERLWSPAALSQNVPDLYRRLAMVSDELDKMGLQHRRAPALLLRNLAAPFPAALPALQTLATVVEPVKEYRRHFQGFTYTTATPLTRLVDAAPAESDVARRFGATADSLLAELSLASRPAFPVAAGAAGAREPLSQAARRQLANLRQQVAAWQLATRTLPPLLVLNPSLSEYAPLAAQLGIVADLLDQRLSRLAGEITPAAPASGPAPATGALLDAAQRPVGQAELAIVGTARRLLR